MNKTFSFLDLCLDILYAHERRHQSQEKLLILLISWLVHYCYDFPSGWVREMCLGSATYKCVKSSKLFKHHRSWFLISKNSFCSKEL